MANHTIVTKTNLPDLLNILNKVAAKYYDLGIQLGIADWKIDNIEQNHSKCEDRLRAVITERLKQEEPLTWHDVATALRAECVNTKWLASQVEHQYLRADQPLLCAGPVSSVPLSVHQPHGITASPIAPHSSVNCSWTLQSQQRDHQFIPSQQPAYFQPLMPHPSSFTYQPHFMPPHSNFLANVPKPIGEAPLQSEPLHSSHPLIQPQLPQWLPRHPFMPPYFPTTPTCLPTLTQYCSPSSHLSPATSSVSADSLSDIRPPSAKKPREELRSQTHSPLHPSQNQSNTEPSSKLKIHPFYAINDGSPDQYPCSASSLTDNPVKQFIEFVKKTYRSEKVKRDTSVVKWPPTPTKVYINLACIDRKRVKINKDYEELTENMIRDGCVDAIHTKKGPIKFSEIAKDISLSNEKDSAGRLILVEGAPGVGKSTFAWEFCRRWEKGEIAQQYQLVLLLRLRDNIISEATTLNDLIYHPLEGVPQAMCKELVLSRELHAMIILEGYDELPDSCRKGSSVFNQLVSGKLLPLATILVTSRPWATQKIRTEHEGRIHQHIEVLGFTRPQVTEYIRSTVPEDEVSGLKAYIERHPQIRMCMYIPLNSAIVVTVYKESQASGLAMPTTLTELYSALARTLLLRYMRGHPEYKNVSALNSFSDLPEAVHSKFNELCRLAYSGIDGSRNRVQLIFKDLPSDFDSLGFMDSVTELYVTRGAVSSHNFLHLTFQEFFAAVHISNLPQEKQLDYFQRHKEGRLKVVLRFLAGLNKLNCFTKDIVNDIFKASPPLEDASKHQVSCDLEVDVDFINWMYEAQSDDVIELLLGQKTVEFSIKPRAMLLMDYYYLGYCIVHSQSQWVLSWEIKEIDEERVKMLTSEAGTQTRTCSKVVALRSNGQLLLSLSTKCLTMLFTKWKYVLYLRELSLCLKVACDKIPWPDLSTLQLLRVEGKGIRCIPLSLSSLKSLTIYCKPERDWHYIADFISHASHLNVLCFCVKAGLSKESLKLEVITRALASITVLPLERLEMPQGSFSDIAVDHLVQFITHTETLQYLSITETKFSAHGLLELAKCLHQRPALQVATKDLEYVINCDNDAEGLVQLQDHYPDIVNVSKFGNSPIKGISDVGAKALAQALKSIDIITLNLSGTNNAIGDDGAVALAKALHHNSTLQKLYLRYNSISDDGAVALAETLHHNSTLQELHLASNSISDDGAVALAETLHHNSTLQKLYLLYNSISDDGAVALAETLHHNSTLQELHLASNSISDDGAVALAKALRHNSTLQELHLSNNSISDDGAEALAKALCHNSTLTTLWLGGNESIGKKGTHQLIESLAVNKSISYLSLPSTCREYAQQSPQYHSVQQNVYFY